MKPEIPLYYQHNFNEEIYDAGLFKIKQNAA